MVERTSRQNDDKSAKADSNPFGSQHDSGESMALHLAKQQSEGFDESQWGLAMSAGKSMLYSGIASPVKALGQFVGVDVPVAAPKEAEFGSKTWYAQTIGSGLGMVAPFLATEAATSAIIARRGAVAANIAERVPMARSLVRPLALTTEEMSATMRFAAPVAKSTLDGAIFGFVLQPSEDPNKSFWSQRFNNAISGGATFGTQSLAASGMMRGWGRLGADIENKAFMTSWKALPLRMGTNAAAGSLAGFVSAELTSKLNTGQWATNDEIAKSVASFVVTGGALDAFHFAKERRAESKANETARSGQPEAETSLVGGRRATKTEAKESSLRVVETPERTLEPPSRQLLEKSRELGRNVEAKFREVDPSRAAEHTADFQRLAERVFDRRGQVQSPKEIETAVDAINRLITTENPNIPLTVEQRLGLAKQLLFEAANPKTVDQGRDLACGPAAVLQIAQHTNPGKHISAVVDLITTGQTRTESGGIIDLSRARLEQIGMLNAVLPDAVTQRSLENAAQPGADPIADGKPSYANKWGMLLYGNARSQLLAPEGQRGIYVQGQRDVTRVEDTGERIFAIKADGSVSREPLKGTDGAPLVGPQVESRDLQRMYDQITGRDSTQEPFVLINTRESLDPAHGVQVLSPRELETILQSGANRPFVVEIDASKLSNMGFDQAASAGKPIRHVLLVEPAMDPLKGKQYKRGGDPLFNVIDTYGRAHDLVGREGATAEQIFDAMRRPTDSPRIEPATQLEGVGNFGEVDAAGLYRGRKPDGPEGMQSLKEKGVTLVIDLIEGPAEAADGTGRSKEHVWADEVGLRYENIKTSVADFSPESVRRVFDVIEAEIARGGRVFLHCARGVDRTGTIAAMWRMTHQDGWTPRLAMAEMRQFGWNGHTPSTQRMGEMVANPPSEFSVRSRSESAPPVEFYKIGGRENPHGTMQRATKAAEALFDQPFMKDHPELEQRAFNIFDSLGTRAPEVVPEGMTNVLNRLSEVLENGQPDMREVDSLMRALESRVSGERLSYDAFFDVMRDRQSAAKFPLADLAALADLSAKSEDSHSVLRMFNDVRNELIEQKLITPSERAIEGGGISADMSVEKIHEALSELPPLERAEYVGKLSREWDTGTPESMAQRQNLLKAYLSVESRYTARDALSPFKDLLSHPETISKLDSGERRRLVDLLVRTSNPTRFADVLTIVQTQNPQLFGSRERVALLRHYQGLNDAAGVRFAVNWATEGTLYRAVEQGHAEDLASRLLTAAESVRLDPQSLDLAYKRLGPYLHPSDIGDASSPRFRELATRLRVDNMDEMSNATFAVYLREIAGLKRIKANDPVFADGRLEEFLQAARQRADESRWPTAHLNDTTAGSPRSDFVNAWMKLIDRVPGQVNKTAARFEALNLMRADDVAALQTTNKNLIKNALSSGQIEQLPLAARAELLTKLLFASHYNENVTSADRNRIVKLLTEDPRMLRELSKEDLHILRDSLAEFVGLDQGVNTLPGAQEVLDVLTDAFIGEPLEPRQIKQVIEGFTSQEVDRIVSALHDRADSLSMKKLSDQFRELADELRRDGFLRKYADRRTSSGRQAEEVTILTLGDATAGNALAYLFYKTTGIKARVVNGAEALAPATEGGGKPKMVLFDPLSSANPAQRAMLENMEGAGLLRIPRKVQSFGDGGVNLFDFALAGAEPDGGPATNRLRQKLADMIGTEPRTDVRPTYPTSIQLEGLQEALSGYSAHDRQVAGTQAMLWLAEEKLNDWKRAQRQWDSAGMDANGDSKLVNWDQIDGHQRTGQVRANLVDHFTEFVTFPEMVDAARQLHRRIIEGNEGHGPIPPEDLLFITDADRGGSGDLMTYLYREANGMTGREFDKQFVTMEEAARRLKEEKGRPGKPRLRLVNVDDIIYSGEQTQKQARKIVDRIGAHGVQVGDRLIMGSLGFHWEGLYNASQGLTGTPKTAGVRLEPIRQYRNHAKTVHDLWQGADPNSLFNGHVEGIFIEDGTGGFQQHEWAQKGYGADSAEVQAGIVLPYMVPNNNLSSLNLLFSKYLGRPRAKPQASYARPEGVTYANDN